MNNLKIITMRDVQTERVEWLWNPYIPSGKITMVQGDPGDGKTTLMFAIAAEVTRGEVIAGCGSTAASAPASVIFQTAEDRTLPTPSNRA